MKYKYWKPSVDKWEKIVSVLEMVIAEDGAKEMKVGQCYLVYKGKNRVKLVVVNTARMRTHVRTVCGHAKNAHWKRMVFVTTTWLLASRMPPYFGK